MVRERESQAEKEFIDGHNPDAGPDPMGPRTFKTISLPMNQFDHERLVAAAKKNRTSVAALLRKWSQKGVAKILDG